MSKYGSKSGPILHRKSALIGPENETEFGREFGREKSRTFSRTFSGTFHELEKHQNNASEVATPLHLHFWQF